MAAVMVPRILEVRQWEATEMAAVVNDDDGWNVAQSKYLAAATDKSSSSGYCCLRLSLFSLE